MQAKKNWAKLTMAIAGILLLIGISTAHAIPTITIDPGTPGQGAQNFDFGFNEPGPLLVLFTDNKTIQWNAGDHYWDSPGLPYAFYLGFFLDGNLDPISTAAFAGKTVSGGIDLSPGVAFAALAQDGVFRGMLFSIGSGFSGTDFDWVWASGDVPIVGVASAPLAADEIIATWGNGIWYLDAALSTWNQLSADTTNEDIAAADFTADGIADVAAIFQLGPASGPQGPGIYYLNGDSKIWTRIPNSAPAPFSVTAGDLTGDGRPEVIATWSLGIWYWDFTATTQEWVKLTDDTTTEDIAAADFTGDNIADVAAIFDFGPVSNPQGPGLYYLNGATKEWTLVPNSSPAPFSATAGDLNADGRPELIATWSVGIWYYDFAAATPAWVQLTTDTTNEAIAAGDFTGNGRADVAAVFEIAPSTDPSAGDGLYYFLTNFSAGFTKIPDSSPAPFNVTVGDVVPE